MRSSGFSTACLLCLLIATSACSKGGNLILEPGARRPKTPDSSGSPFIQVNQGGNALLFEAGQSSTVTGYHATISIQSTSAAQIKDAGSGVWATIKQ